jgi:predicted AlkP superfamily phosphohydrolase/phosphomutase
VNLKGRERHGIVEPGAAYQSLRKELVQKFGDLRDPETGARVVRRVFTRDELYKGPYFHEAPDMVVGFEKGYRVSWQTSLGGIPPDVFEPNERRWSADHCSVDPAQVPGVLFSNRPIGRSEARIIDVAPSVLTRLGVAPPAGMDGVNLELR